MLSSIKTKLRSLLRRSRLERELDEELRHHIEQQLEQNIRLGMKFGGVEQSKEESRDACGLRWIAEVGRDLRYSARTLAKKPVFTLVIILTLALGIGANTAIFSVYNGIILKPLPYKEPHRLVNIRRSDGRVTHFQPGVDARFDNFSPGGFHDWRERSRRFENMTAYRQNSTILADPARTMYVAGLNA